MKRITWIILSCLLQMPIFAHADVSYLSMDKDTLLQKAESGDPNAQTMLGLVYVGNLGTPRDDAQSFAWFRKAAAQEDAIAQKNLGEAYEQGRGVPKDNDQAIEWYRKSAEQGYTPAKTHLREMFNSGQLAPIIDDHTGPWWRELAEQAITETKKFSVLSKAAESGAAIDQINLGLAYLTGVGTLKDRGQATILFRRAADQGQTEAKCLLAIINASDSDWNLPSNNLQAVDFCRKASDDGFADAQYLLGVLYSMGRSISTDKQQSAIWIHKAADQGRPDAQFMLGLNYDLGNGVEKDKKQANIWYQKAADNGNPDAMNSIGMQRMNTKFTANNEDETNKQNSEYMNLALEHSSDKKRDLLSNLRASPSEQAREKGSWKSIKNTLVVILIVCLVLAYVPAIIILLSKRTAGKSKTKWVLFCVASVTIVPLILYGLLKIAIAQGFRLDLIFMGTGISSLIMLTTGWIVLYVFHKRNSIKTTVSIQN